MNFNQNNLNIATSPYLKQHEKNPVWWQSWSDEVLNYAKEKKGKALRWNDPRTARTRSKTFPGIARAMAEQWGGDIREEL